MNQKKLAVVVTHPIQYYAPIFSLLAKEINVKVFYTWGKDSVSKFDPGFGKVIEWDIPLLDGYQFEFLENTAKKPGSSHFNGIKNPHIITQIDDFKPNAILVFGWCYYSHLSVIRHYKGKVPIFFRGDSNLLDRPNSLGLPLLKELLKKLFLKWLYHHIDFAFYCGKENKKYFEWVGMKNHQLLFAPHAIDNERFFNVKKKQKNIEIRNQLNIGINDILVLFAGKFEQKKNPIGLLNVFKKISQNGSSVHLLFVGNGILENQLKVEARTLSNIHFVPFQNQLDLPDYYYACDLFCLPSNGPGETWGLAVNEAMACGKAVLVSDKVGSASDLVTIDFNGSIFKANNEQDLYEKLFNLVIDKNRLKRMGINSRSIIERWSISEISSSILSHFHLYAL